MSMHACVRARKHPCVHVCMCMCQMSKFCQIRNRKSSRAGNARGRNNYIRQLRWPGEEAFPDSLLIIRYFYAQSAQQLIRMYIFFHTRYWRAQQCRTCVRSTAKGSSRREENVSSTIKPNAVPSTSRPDGKRELGACHAIRFEGRDNVEVQRSMGNIPLDRLPS